MKTQMISMKFKYLFASLLVSVSILAMAAAPVAAAGPAATATPAASGEHLAPFAYTQIAKRYTDAELSAMFQKDQRWFETLQAEVKQQDKVTVPAGRLSDEKGAALAKTDGFISSEHTDLAREKDLFEDIQNVISNRAGFAANGDVTNSAMAAQTIGMLEAMLRDAQYWLGRADINFMHARVAR